MGHRLERLIFCIKPPSQESDRVDAWGISTCLIVELNMRTVLCLVSLAGIAFMAMLGVAHAAAICRMPDGSAGLSCVVPSSGETYGCVKDLKDCGALSPTRPSGASAAGATTSSSGQATGSEKITKSRSNIQNN
jgi:hypothetical protein